MIESKIGQRAGGVFFLACGSALAGWSWYTAIERGQYNLKAALLGPGLAVAGLTLLFFPLDYALHRTRYNTANPPTFAQYPMSWKVLTIVAFAAGATNWLALHSLGFSE